MKIPLASLLTMATPKGFCDTRDLSNNFWTDLETLIGQKINSIALSRACKVIAPHLIAQHPWLANLDVSHVNRENVFEELARLEAIYGSSFEVEPVSVKSDRKEELRSLTAFLQEEGFYDD